MASLGSQSNEMPPKHIEIPIQHANDDEAKPSEGGTEENKTDYSQRAQWLRAAVLGANDGLVSVSSLMMGVGAVNKDIAAMLLAGFAGLVAGACSMAIGEFVSVYTQLDIELAQMKRDREANNDRDTKGGEDQEKLPNPFQAAMASAIAFSVGAVVPLIAAVFIREYKVRVAVVAAVASLALLVFGGVGAVIGKTPVRRSCVRVVIGGWMAMAITLGLTKLIGSAGI